ncbi:MAG: SDR family oxidoreductase, partial [Ilumatobacteraceae bacterium]
PMNLLQDRVAIVTGAAGGVGSAAARRFAEEGASVVLADIDGDAAQAVGDLITAAGGSSTVVPCDVSKEQDIDDVVTAAISTYGRIDILANIAQGSMGDHSYLETTSAELAFANFATGPVQSMLFMQKCLPHMKERGYGRIINTASHSALVGAAGFAPYEMAKGAVMALTRNASQEWAKFGIVTNTFLPVVRTPAFDMTAQGRAAAVSQAESNPTGRFGTPYEDCSPVLVFLASEGAGYVNGQAIGVDGGRFLIA